MARKFLTPIDLNKLELQNAAIQNLAVAPGSPNVGQVYYNTVENKIKVWTGSSWDNVGSSQEEIEDYVNGLFEAGNGISLVYDDVENSLTVANTGVLSVSGTADEITVSASAGNVTISLPATINADTTGNAATATALETARTISFGGDLSGSATFDGTQDITITGFINTDSAVDSVTGTANEIEVSASVGAVTISLPDNIHVDVTGNLTGNADTASALQTARTIALGGDLSGSVSFDGSASVTINADIQPDSVALGTDTTGDYVASVSASDGISATGTGEGASVSLTNTDKGSSQNIFKTFEGDTGSFTAGSNSASVTVAGGTGISTSASAGTLTITNDGVVTVSGTENQVDVSASSGNVTVSLPSSVVFPGTVTLNADPTQALEAATKQYVDAVAEGLHVHASVAAATTASVNLSSPPAAIDGVTLVDGMRVLVKDQSNAAQNGIYVYDLDTTSLVRSNDYDTAGEIDPGDFVFVSGGSTYADTGWVQTETITTLETDSVLWSQFSGAGTYVAGNGLELTGTVFSIDTDVTVDVSTAQTLTNKTLTSPVVSGLYLSDNEIVIEGDPDTNETRLVFTNPTDDRVITFKDATGTVAFTSDIPSNTDGLTEGSTNLYFTSERAEDAIGAILTDTATVDFTYTDNGASAGTITADVILKASNSYLTSASGLAVDITTLEAKLVTDSFAKKAAANVGNGLNLSFAVVHNFGTEDVIVQIFDNVSHDTVEADVVRTDVNTVTVSFASAPSANQYRVVIIG